MFLEYGVSKDGELVYVDYVQRGPTDLLCPYCGGALLAKKGKVIAHHFAHAGNTCRQVARNLDRIALPCYDNFNLHLAGKVLQALLDFPDSRYVDAKLEARGLIKLNPFARRGRGEMELTHKGKIPRGELSLRLFNEFQEPILYRRHVELEADVTEVHKRPEWLTNRIHWEQDEIEKLKRQYADRSFMTPIIEARQRTIKDLQAQLDQNDAALQTAIIDLKLYRAQLRRILSCSLYFIQIMGLPIYKIGVTTRPIEMRIDEIAFDLKPHFGHDVHKGLKLLGLWEHRGNVELYFKHRYKAHNKPIGDLTEYFQFEDVRPVLRDLRRMKPYDLDEWEQEILDGDPLPKSLQSILGERTNS